MHDGQHTISTRDILRAACCGFTLLLATLAVVQLGAFLRATILLDRAARLGAAEARLPGASWESVVGAAKRPLVGTNLADATCELLVAGENELVRPLSLATSNETIEVLVSIPAAVAVPDLFGWCGLPASGTLMGCIRTQRDAPR